MLAVYIENGLVTLRRRPRPRRRDGFALIRLLCAGICSTDLELQRGYYGFRGTPGHEFVGEVVEAGSPRLTGQRVVGEINAGCGKCAWCARDLGRHCPRRKVLGILGLPGAFAEYLVLPERNLHVVHESIPTDCAVFTEPLAAACEILDQVHIPRGEAAAVLGDGRLGLLTAQVLHQHGIEVHLYGLHREKLKIAQAAGIRTYRSPQKPRAAYDWIVEATGVRGGLDLAARMARPRAVIIMKSTIHDTVPVDTARLIVNEISLVGSRCGKFEAALELLRDDRIRVDDMISAKLPLPDAPRAFELAARGGLKVLLIP